VGFVVIVAVVLHNPLGLLGGYWSGKPIDEQPKKDVVKQV
jgi:predicted Na+-dependent transporter